jgi:hypothetical protein
MKQMVIDSVQAGMNQMDLFGSPNSVATAPPMLAMTGIGQNDKP